MPTLRPNHNLTRRKPALLLALAALYAFNFSAAAQSTVAQGAYPNADSASGDPTYSQSSPAPIVRVQSQPRTIEGDSQSVSQQRVRSSQPAQGVYLTVSPDGNVTTVANSVDRMELRLDRGVANVAVHHPASRAILLVNFAGGQVNLLGDGFYTFNAETRTVHVLQGAAAAFNSTDATSGAKPVKVKENHALTLGTPGLQPVEFQPYQAGADVLASPNNAYAMDDGGGAYGYSYRSPYDGYGYGYPYYAFNSPYFGYPYGFGLGFGYNGSYYGRGFRGGGFRGGYGGGYGFRGGFGGGFRGGRR